MILKKIVGVGAIAGALGFSALGLAGAANAEPTPHAGSSVVHQAQLANWGGGRGGGGGFHGGGGGFHGDGRGFGGPGFNRGFGGPGFGPGFGGPGFGGRGFGGPPCLIGRCL